MRPHLLCIAVLAGALAERTSRSEDAIRPAVDGAVTRGVAALGSAQAADGHFGRDYPIAVTSMAGLAILAGEDEPLRNTTLLRCHAWLRGRQKDGAWPQECHTWVHVQGFATLFFAELYGKTLLATNVPDALSKDELRATVTRAVVLLEEAQSKSGGWFYTKAPDQD